MADNVREKIGSEPPAEILEAAEQSDEYTEVDTGENPHEAYRGDNLMIIGRSESSSGVYIEEIPSDPDPSSDTPEQQEGENSQKTGSQFDPIDQKPWEGMREITYNVEGNPAEVKQRIYGKLNEKDYLFDSHSEEGIETWIDSNDPDVRIELRGDKIIMKEYGPAEIPGFETMDGIDIEQIWREAQGEGGDIDSTS